MTARAVVVDGWSVLRSGVAAVLAGCGIEVCGQASLVGEAAALARRDGADVFVVGAVADGADVVGVLRAAAPGARVVLLLDQPDRQTTVGAFESGADAVLTREATETELRDAVMRVLRGERFASPGLLAGLFGSTESVAGDHGLTERERAVLAELARGCSNRQIAAALYIGEATVKTHLRNIYDKLDVANRVQAVGRAIDLHLV